MSSIPGFHGQRIQYNHFWNNIGLIYDEIKGNPHLRLGRSVTQTPAHAPTTDAITSTGMDIEMEDSAFGESLEQETRYNPFQGIDGLEGCSSTGLGSALSWQTEELALWRQVRGGRKMETIRTDIVERLYSSHPSLSWSQSLLWRSRCR